MEILNANGTVYSTRTNTYNARDQVTSIKQYQGLESSGIYQEIIKTYDGYGRVVSHKEPIQTTAATYTYNADSQPASATDARGITQTYTYNSRDLLTSVSYSGGTPLAAVNLTYDGAGNRTSMTDGTGSRTYSYDQLSQLTSEARQFTGLSGSFMLTYEYNLAGALKSFMDHVGSRVNYNFNTVGMLTSVTGSGAHSASTYASNFAYRASGAIKDFDYGNGVHQHHNFNSRTLNTSLSLTLGSSTSNWNYDYYADGKLQKVSDTDNPVFDRAFDYDQVGRLVQARTGSEARGGSTADGPFKQTYGYDVWENTTTHTNRLWTETPVTTNSSFTNNRNQYWGYDNDGNVLNGFDAYYDYDAAGRQNYFASHATVGGLPTPHPVESALEISQTFDGNSAPVKKTTTNRWEEYIGETLTIQESTASVYYLRSSVLGGKVVAELDETGYKRLGYVFAGGMQIASQHVLDPGPGHLIDWASTSPATGSEYRPLSSLLSRQELDPLGNDVTNPPDPMFIPEPVFYNPKFDDMPLLMEGGPSAAYEQANADWAVLVTATIQAAQDRARAESLWQSGKRSEAMAILAKNPNVGVEYRAIYKNEVIRSGSYFGQAAADFMNGISLAVDAGWLSPVIGTSNINMSAAVSGLSALQQNSYSEVYDTVGRVLKSPKCNQFALDILSVVSKDHSVYPEGGTLFDVFSEFIKQPRPQALFTRNLGGSLGYGSVRGNIRKGTAQIALPGFPDADGIISELFHLAGRNRPYSDKELAEAVRRFPQHAKVANDAIEPIRNIYDSRYQSPPDWTEKNEGGYSAYFHYAQFNICFTGASHNGMKRLIR